MDSLALATQALRQLQARGPLEPKALDHLERMMRAIDVLQECAAELVQLSAESALKLEI